MPFSEIVGNAALVERVAQMARARRVPPSMLFSGRAGVGKVRTAVTLAQALNCAVGDGDACGRCPSCLRIGRDEHSDVRVLRPEGKGAQIKVEGVREAIAEVPYRPFEGRHRVIVVVDAERMNPTTANTLLKTLEEPPPWASLILITANEASLLPTLLSRCQILRFSPLAPDELVEILVKERGIDESEALLLASVSGGGLSRALELQKEPLAELRSEALRIARVASDGALAGDLVPWADALSKESRLLIVLDLLLAVLRDVAAKTAGAAILHRDLEREVESLAKSLSLERWLTAYTLAEAALIDMRDRYLNKRITLSRLLVSFDELSGRTQAR
jgi:DNA polymerase III subunit delta'